MNDTTQPQKKLIYVAKTSSLLYPEIVVYADSILEAATYLINQPGGDLIWHLVVARNPKYIDPHCGIGTK